MKWALHHVNLPTREVQESVDFFRNLIGLSSGLPHSIGTGTTKYDLPMHKFQTVGHFNGGLHLGRPVFELIKKTGLPINASIGGHAALAVSNIADIKSRLDRAGVFYADAGQHAMQGVNQIYLYDPAANIIEINDDLDLTSAPAVNWCLHHVTISAFDVPASAAFYRDILGLDIGAPHSMGSGSSSHKTAAEFFYIIGDGNRGLHLAKPVPDYCARTGLPINVTMDGHVAITVADISTVKRNLELGGVFYLDAGCRSMKDVYQIYLYDPAANIIEVNQVEYGSSSQFVQ